MTAEHTSEQSSARETYAKLHANTFGPGHQGQTSQEAQAALDEIDRLRAHIKTLHQLNGYSKQRGWWCSCRHWHAGFRYVQGEMPPWNRTTEAIAAHHQHVLSMVCGPRATSTSEVQP